MHFENAKSEVAFRNLNALCDIILFSKDFLA
jgi:hypothetical protein